MTDKALLYDSLLSQAKSLIARDDLILKNEAELARLKYEIDFSMIEVAQKRELVIELEGELDKEKKRYKALKVEIKRLEKRAE